MTSLNGKMLEAKSPNGTTELLEAFFERARSQETQKRSSEGDILFNDIQGKVLSLVDKMGVKEDETEYQKYVRKQKTGNMLNYRTEINTTPTHKNKKFRAIPNSKK